MKTYKNLWEQFISPENLELAVKKAVKSKKNKPQTKLFLQNKDALMKKLRDDLIHNRFRVSRYRTYFVFEPKKREIYELPLYPDHIVHHALINVLAPLWQTRFIRDSYACIPGRGIHSAVQRAMLFVKKNKYVLQCDVRKFYPSIDHNIMMNVISKKIHDRKILGLLRRIIFSIDGGKNLPIGNLTSQWMGNLYLTELDLFVKHVLGAKNYLRYSDDFCVFHDDKRFLTMAKVQIAEFLDAKLNLRLSRANVRLANGMAFVGFRLFRDFIVLRRKTVKKGRNRMRDFGINKKYLSCVSRRSCLAAVNGLLKWAKTYNLKREISRHVVAWNWGVG